MVVEDTCASTWEEGIETEIEEEFRVRDENLPMGLIAQDQSQRD